MIKKKKKKKKTAAWFLVPNFNFVGLTVPEKSDVMTFSMFENGEKKIWKT